MLCKEMHQRFSVFNNPLGHIHAYVLEPLSGIGFTDGRKQRPPYYLPFAEYGAYTSDLLKALQKESPADEYLGKLATEDARYKALLQILEREKKTASPLTGREKEILRSVIEANKEIADTLFVAEVTVKKNITAVYRKLRTRGRADAVRKALGWGSEPLLPNRAHTQAHHHVRYMSPSRHGAPKVCSLASQQNH